MNMFIKKESKEAESGDQIIIKYQLLNENTR